MSSGCRTERWAARERVAARLLRTAAAHSYDPDVEILMQMLIRHAYDRDLATGHVRWTLTEIGDECRHSAMFARMVQTYGCPSYRPSPLTHWLGKLCKTTSDSSLTFGGTLYVEGILDGFQRAAMKDPAVQPTSRAVSRVHVVEEARHIRFAREQLRRSAPRLRGVHLARARWQIALVAYVATRALIHPQVYASVGLDVPTAVAAAAANPHWRDAKQASEARVMEMFQEADWISGPSRRLWVAVGLLD